MVGRKQRMKLLAQRVAPAASDQLDDVQRHHRNRGDRRRRACPVGMAIVSVGRVAERNLASEFAFTPACPMTFREFLHQCGKGLGVLSPYGDYESGICTLVVGETVTCAKARISSTVWGGYRLLDRRCAGRRRTPELHVVDVG